MSDATTSQGSGQTGLAGLETELVNRLNQRIASLRQTNPEWFAYLEDVDPDTARRAELVDMMASAPNDLLLGFLYGKFTNRLVLATITGREFT